MAHIILYIDGGFGGLHTHVFDQNSNLQKTGLGGRDSGIDGVWNDKVYCGQILRPGKRPVSIPRNLRFVPLPNEVRTRPSERGSWAAEAL
jgi:hypothetical protein